MNKERSAEFNVRLGRVCGYLHHFNGGYVRISRAIQIAGTWRSLFAWRLARELGWEVT